MIDYEKLAAACGLTYLDGVTVKYFDSHEGRELVEEKVRELCPGPVQITYYNGSVAVELLTANNGSVGGMWNCVKSVSSETKFSAFATALVWLAERKG